MSAHRPTFARVAAGLSLLALIAATLVAGTTAATAAFIRGGFPISVSCSPNPIVAGGQTTCTAITGNSDYPVPEGFVGFKSSRGGQFAECELQGEPFTSVSFCNVLYKPEGNGFASRKDTITAGHTNIVHSRKGSATTKVGVLNSPPKPTPDISVVCPGTIVAGQSDSCSVAVVATNGGATPSGTVTFKSTRPTGFGVKTCTLAPAIPGIAECSLTYTPTGAGYPSRVDTITGNYPGDQNWGPAEASDTTEVPKTLS